MNDARRVILRKTHPVLYQQTTYVAIWLLGLAANFWYYTPTFEPYSIPKAVVGAVCFALGASQLVLLNFARDLSKLRWALVISIVLTFAWGIANTQQAFTGSASLQLPMTFLAICAVQIPIVIYLPVRERAP